MYLRILPADLGLFAIIDHPCVLFRIPNGITGDGIPFLVRFVEVPSPAIQYPIIGIRAPIVIESFEIIFIAFVGLLTSVTLYPFPIIT